MSEYEKVVALYPRITRKDFEFLEASRQWMTTTKDDETVQNYFKQAIRETSITPGLISMILAGHNPKKILMYPYNDYPPMQLLKPSHQTLFNLNNVVKLIKWQPKIDKHGLRLEQVNSKSRARQALYNACTSDLGVQQYLTKLGVDIPITQTNALHITLCPASDLKIIEVPESLMKAFAYGIGISVTGVSIGFSLDYPKFSWFICVEVDIQKTIDYINLVLDIKCQAPYITIAAKPR